MFFFENIEWIAISKAVLIINIIIGFATLFMLIKFIKGIWQNCNDDLQKLPEVLWAKKWRIVGVFIWTLLAVSIISSSYLYQPKNVLDGGSIDAYSKEQEAKRKNEPSPKLVVPESEKSWEELKQQNRKEQEDAKRKFNKLPE